MKYLHFLGTVCLLLWISFVSIFSLTGTTPAAQPLKSDFTCLLQSTLPLIFFKIHCPTVPFEVNVKSSLWPTSTLSAVWSMQPVQSHNHLHGLWPSTYLAPYLCFSSNRKVEESINLQFCVDNIIFCFIWCLYFILRRKLCNFARSTCISEHCTTPRACLFFLWRFYR